MIVATCHSYGAKPTLEAAKTKKTLPDPRHIKPIPELALFLKVCKLQMTTLTGNNILNADLFTLLLFYNTLNWDFQLQWILQSTITPVYHNIHFHLQCSKHSETCPKNSEVKGKF